jgi:hypothetical protein
MLKQQVSLSNRPLSLPSLLAEMEGRVPAFLTLPLEETVAQPLFPAAALARQFSVSH